MADYFDTQAEAEKYLKGMNRRVALYVRIKLHGHEKWVVDEEVRPTGPYITVLENLTHKVTELRTKSANTPTPAHIITQKCIRCSTDFDARMVSCPNCGSKDGSIASGGMEVVQIMAAKQKAIEMGDRAAGPFNNGKFDEAIAITREAIKINPMYEQAHSNLGFALTAKGDYQEAVRVFEHVLSFSPHRDEAQRGLATAKSKLPQTSSNKPKSPPPASTPPPTKGKWWQFWK